MRRKESKVINVGLFGLGTVGSGVAELLIEKHEALKRRSGFDFRLKCVCEKQLEKRKHARLGGARVTDDPDKILNDPEIDQVVELIGGIHPALEIIKKSLLAGKDVITANKALLAQRGIEIYKVLKKTRRHLGLEASVAGGIPILKALKEGLIANSIDHFSAILNGTTNMILTEMSQRGRPYGEALREAQRKGIAEKDPSLDVSGKDTAHKLAIMARIAFQKEFDLREIPCSGIRSIEPVDIEHAKAMGYVIKLVAHAQALPKEIELRVHPALLPETHPLARVNGVHNAILISGSETGDVFFYGKGAGKKPAASAVVGDMIDLAKLRAVEFDPYQEIFEKARIADPMDLVSRFYIRLYLRDVQGALGRITRILGDQRISIASVHQAETRGLSFVPVIFLTHDTLERNVWKAVREIRRSSIVRKGIVVFHVED